MTRGIAHCSDVDYPVDADNESLLARLFASAMVLYTHGIINYIIDGDRSSKGSID